MSQGISHKLILAYPGFQRLWIKHSQSPIPGVLTGSCSTYQVNFATLYNIFFFEGPARSQLAYAGIESVIILTLRSGDAGSFREGSPIALWKIVLITIL